MVSSRLSSLKVANFVDIQNFSFDRDHEYFFDHEAAPQVTKDMHLLQHLRTYPMIVKVITCTLKTN